MAVHNVDGSRKPLNFFITLLVWFLFQYDFVVKFKPHCLAGIDLLNELLHPKNYNHDSGSVCAFAALKR